MPYNKKAEFFQQLHFIADPTGLFYREADKWMVINPIYTPRG